MFSFFFFFFRSRLREQPSSVDDRDKCEKLSYCRRKKIKYI